MFPDFKNMRLQGTDVAGIQKRFQANEKALEKHFVIFSTTL